MPRVWGSVCARVCPGLQEPGLSSGCCSHFNPLVLKRAGARAHLTLVFLNFPGSPPNGKALVNLFVGNGMETRMWRTDLWTRWGRGRVDQWRRWHQWTHRHSQVSRFGVVQGAQLGALRGPGGMGWGEGREGLLYNYGWFVLLYFRNQHDRVKKNF